MFRSVRASRRERARQLAHHSFPIALRRLKLGHPETPRQGHLDLIFTGTSFRFAARAAHHKFARRTPEELDAADRDFITGLRAGKSIAGRRLRAA